MLSSRNINEQFRGRYNAITSVYEERLHETETNASLTDKSEPELSYGLLYRSWGDAFYNTVG